MRETVGSLRVYFLIAGTLGVAATVLAVSAQPSVPTVFFALPLAGMAASYLYAGILIRHLIVSDPVQLKWIVLFGAGLMGLQVVLNLFTGSPAFAVRSGIGVVVGWYLFVNVQRLSAPSAEAVASEPA